MIPRGAWAFAVASLIAACGGKVADDVKPLVGAGSASATPPTLPTSSATPPAPTTTGTSLPPAPPIPKGDPRACGLYDGDSEANLKAFGLARAIGVYEVFDVTEECSGAGGTHVSLLRVDGCSSGQIVHYGEHACSIDWQKGDRAVVGVDPTAGSIPSPTGWCLDAVKPWNGVARAVRKLDPSETVEAALGRYACVP